MARPGRQGISQKCQCPSLIQHYFPSNGENCHGQPTLLQVMIVASTASVCAATVANTLPYPITKVMLEGTFTSGDSKKVI